MDAKRNMNAMSDAKSTSKDRNRWVTIIGIYSTVCLYSRNIYPYRQLCIPKSRHFIKAKLNSKCPNFARPKSHVISNGAFVFAPSVIFCGGKCMKYSRKLSLHSTSIFRIIGKLNAPFKRAVNFGLEATLILRFYIHVICICKVHDFCLWRTWRILWKLILTFNI
jgi:hypothetical protein